MSPINSSAFACSTVRQWRLTSSCLDFVLEVGDQQIPVQVQYRRSIDPVRDTRGIRAFVEEPGKPAPFGLLITQTDGPAIDDPRIVAMPLSTFMLLA